MGTAAEKLTWLGAAEVHKVGYLICDWGSPRRSTGKRVAMGRICHLLMVDDDMGQVTLMKAMLETLGLQHKCDHVVDGTLALEYLGRQRPDLVLLDFNLPGKSGCEVLMEIKSNPQLRSIPVIVLSTSRSKEDVQACYGHHANAYVRKAANLDEALRIVKAIDHFWMQTVELPNTEIGNG